MLTDDLTALARALLRMRRDRTADLPAELFGGERGWDILLAMFVADAQGRRLTGARVLAAVDCPARVGKRWLAHLARLHLIIGAGAGQLDNPLTLTPSALQAMERWLAGAWATLAEERSRG